jgi:hypothetical protein
MSNKKPHKHAELIKAWADGAEIEVRSPYTENKWELHKNPQWVSDHEYRIKPEPNPDVVRFVQYAWNPSSEKTYGGIPEINCLKFSNLKLTFSGETGKLKSAEVL